MDTADTCNIAVDSAEQMTDELKAELSDNVTVNTTVHHAEKTGDTEFSTAEIQRNQVTMQQQTAMVKTVRKMSGS